MGIVHLSIMAEDAVQHLKGEVSVLYGIEKLNALYSVAIRADLMCFTKSGETIFSKVTLGRVADVVTEGNRLNQVIV